MQTTKFWVVFGNCLLILVSVLPAAGQDKAYLSIDASKGRAKIDCNSFGQFNENPGRGLYGGSARPTVIPIPTRSVSWAQAMRAGSVWERLGADDYARHYKSTLFLDGFLRRQEAVMEKYDPQNVAYAIQQLNPSK